MTLLRDPTKNIDLFVRKYTEASSLISMHHSQKWRTQAKTPFGATPTVPQRLPRTLVRLPNYLMASCSLFKRFAQSALVRLPNYLMASCSLLLGSLNLLQRKSLHGSPQRQSLHVSSFVSACRSVMHHFSASRYMALHSANRFMSIFNSLSALAAHAPLHPL